MPDLEDNQTVEVQGSSGSTYTLKNVGGVYSCTCPAWRNQSIGIEQRTCKHIRAYRGDDAEKARLGDAALTGKPARAKKVNADGEEEEDGNDAPPLLLAHKWEMDLDLTNWWMSEKLDGVRAYWDGTQFISRLGNVFHAPDWFIADLPKTALDGELWGGRKTFQKTVGIVKRQDKPPEWKTIRYLVFDAPKHGGTFEERLKHLEDVALEGKLQYARMHPHQICRDVAHLKEELAKVEALGGEGLMLRKPGSKYEAGRSFTLLKVKTFHDAEAKVIDHVAGMGKHKGRLGALLVELEDGTRFNVGTGFSDKERESPPKVGSIITFRYQELSDGGVPRFPSYVGEAIDKAFESHPKEKPAPIKLFEKTQKSPEPIGPAKIRRFEMKDGDQNLFWEIEVVGNKHRVRYGSYEAKAKTFESAGAALVEAEARIADKVGKGFKETE
jgi:DNA ligase-1